MHSGIERRRCIRFEVPGMTVKYRKRGLLVFSRSFSGPLSARDISKGGLSFVCDEKMSRGRKLVVQLMIPGEYLLNLDAVVRRQERALGGNMMLTGVEFIPFGDGFGLNKIDSLDILRNLEKKHGEGNRTLDSIPR